MPKRSTLTPPKNETSQKEDTSKVELLFQEGDLLFIEYKDKKSVGKVTAVTDTNYKVLRDNTKKPIVVKPDMVIQQVPDVGGSFWYHNPDDGEIVGSVSTIREGTKIGDGVFDFELTDEDEILSIDPNDPRFPGNQPVETGSDPEPESDVETKAVEKTETKVVKTTHQVADEMANEVARRTATGDPRGSIGGLQGELAEDIRESHPWLLIAPGSGKTQSDFGAGRGDLIFLQGDECGTLYEHSGKKDEKSEFLKLCFLRGDTYWEERIPYDEESKTYVGEKRIARTVVEKRELEADLRGHEYVKENGSVCLDLDGAPYQGTLQDVIDLVVGVFPPEGFEWPEWIQTLETDDGEIAMMQFRVRGYDVKKIVAPWKTIERQALRPANLPAWAGIFEIATQIKEGKRGMYSTLVVKGAGTLSQGAVDTISLNLG